MTAHVTHITKQGAYRSRPRSHVRSFCRGVILGVAGASMLVGMAATGYVIKSAAGINLFPGKSVLHEPLWPIAVAVRQRIAAVRQVF